jgi:hypothetical protein
LVTIPGRFSVSVERLEEVVGAEGSAGGTTSCTIASDTNSTASLPAGLEPSSYFFFFSSVI